MEGPLRPYTMVLTEFPQKVQCRARGQFGTADCELFPLALSHECGGSGGIKAEQIFFCKIGIEENECLPLD